MLNEIAQEGGIDQLDRRVIGALQPDVLELPVEALLWIKTRPDEVESTGRALLTSPLVRYAAAITGEYQLVADITVASRAALYEFVTAGEWLSGVELVETCLVVSGLKRSGVTSASTLG
ncbi:Lrp/AsnC ligand binding domain-containing protein [Haloactinomyces albus]|uniref:Transcription regulator AsnC/Lrp ligand binding domain-containing protein n=1 Tax=Haloactinomyces albus TaxID=1352928 RepID=A0AAE4CRV5_9ACTN|nr:Lrp/AsnC ligand binding domain-containing protein [Haloactinomyces albus]MDR7304078.1 hypothetical protein [Haloactinomyces albus]